MGRPPTPSLVEVISSSAVQFFLAAKHFFLRAAEYVAMIAAFRCIRCYLAVKHFILRAVKPFLNKNLATIAALILIGCVLWLVPQIKNIWWESPRELLVSGDNFEQVLGVGFSVFVLGLLWFYAAASFSVIPEWHLADNGLPTFRRRPRSFFWSFVQIWRLRCWLSAMLFVLLFPARLMAAFPKWLARKLGQRGRRIPTVLFSLIALAFLAHEGVFLFDHHCFFHLEPDVEGWFLTPLAGASFYLVGWMIVTWAGWWLYCAYCGQPVGVIFTMVGRICAIQFFTSCVGEVLWLGAHHVTCLLSYRLYTIWAVFHLAFDILAIAIVLDVVNRRVTWPFRAIVLFAGVLLLAITHDTRPTLRPSSGSDTGVTANCETLPDWYDHLYQRILETDEGTPVVFVASSGGGSRAALFTALVLEALENEPLRDSRDQVIKPGLHWADQIVLMSSVSGGSLGNAYYAQRLTQEKPKGRWRKPHASFYDGLRTETDNQYKDIWPRYQQDCEEAKQQPGLSQDADKSDRTKTTYDLYLWSTFADDMCTDFMAPLLRGFMVQEVERGRSLAAFWDQQFEWNGVTNRNFTYCRNSRTKHRPPLLLFNATREKGTRFVIGFPPLTPNTFHDGMTHPDEREAIFETETLEDFSPAFELRLAEAVRLSANFPWGIPPGRLTHESRQLKAKLGTKQEDALIKRLTGNDAPSLRTLTQGEKGGSNVGTQVLRELYPQQMEKVEQAIQPADRPKKEVIQLLRDIVFWLDHARLDRRLPQPTQQAMNDLMNALEVLKVDDKPVRVLETKVETATILDGGINDNTGILTIYELLEHLDQLATLYQKQQLKKLCNVPAPSIEALLSASLPDDVQKCTRAAKAWQIVHELRRRSVLLVEIDSGAKLTLEPIPFLRGLRIPYQALTDATYVNADAAKEQCLERINTILKQRQEVEKSPTQQRNKMTALPPVFHLQFIVNHGTSFDVRTTWALPPLDKAKMYATFFCELRYWHDIKQPMFQRPWQRYWESRKKNQTDMGGDAPPSLVEDTKKGMDLMNKQDQEKKKRPIGQAKR